MATKATSTLLTGLSDELASVVARLAPSIVRVDDGSRLTATGLIWSVDGLIVTTSHGVERDENLAIELNDGTRHAATLVGRDPDTDLALLRVTSQDLLAAATATTTQIGQLVLALGQPGETGLQATLGIISARLETQRDGQPEYLLHTDAVLYPGFSGGPLVNMQSQVVGLHNLIYGRGRGIALGIPTVAHVVEALLAHGRVQRGYLGIRMQLAALPQHLRASLDLIQEHGLIIIQVENNSPAEQAGLLLGDTLLGLDDQEIQDVEDLRHYLRDLSAGQQIKLRILRGGELRDVSVTLQAAP